MGIQSLNGYTGSVPLPAQARSESAPPRLFARVNPKEFNFYCSLRALTSH